MSILSVIIAAHGSSSHSGGADVAERCRQQLEQTGTITGALLCAFWKGEGLHLRDAIAQCPAGYVLIIPLLMSDGYFGETVFPREFGVPVQTVGWTKYGSHHVRLSPPAGLDPRFDTLMTDIAMSVLTREPVPRLVLTGHGTERDPRSSRRLYELVAELRKRGDADTSMLSVAFLDEAPTLHEVLQEDDRPAFILPWFAADGAHAGEDIPAIVARWGGKAEISASVGARLFPLICASRVHDALESLGSDHEF